MMILILSLVIMFVLSVKINYKESKMKNKLLCALLFVTPLARATINTEVIPSDWACYAGQACYVADLHSIRIINETTEPRTYHWSFSMVGVNGDVVNKNGNVTLQPHEEFRQDRFKLDGYMKFNMRGRKDLKCITEGSTFDEHSEQTRYGSVNVY